MAGGFTASNCTTPSFLPIPVDFFVVFVFVQLLWIFVSFISANEDEDVVECDFGVQFDRESEVAG